MVVTAMAPTLRIASQIATAIALFGLRIATRFPGTTPCASR